MSKIKMEGHSSRPSTSLPRKEVLRATHLEPSYADTGRARWEKLSAANTFSTSAPPYLTSTVDPDLLEAANIHCTNKASMLRMQHRSQNMIRPNSDLKKTAEQNKLFELKSKILTASVVLSSGSDMSHGFLLGSRYNSHRTIDTNPLKLGGVCVSRSSKSRSFFSPTQHRSASSSARRAYSAPHSRTPTITAAVRAPRSKVIVQEPTNWEPLCIHGVKYGEEERPRSRLSASVHRPANQDRLGVNNIKYGTEETGNPPSASDMLSPPFINDWTTSDLSEDTGHASNTEARMSSAVRHAPSSRSYIPNVRSHTPNSRSHTPNVRSHSPSYNTVTSTLVSPPCSSPTFDNTVEEDDYNDDDNFYKENENDLLSPEAQKLTSEILMAISRTSLGSRTISQVSVSSTSSLEAPGDIERSAGVSGMPGPSDHLVDNNGTEDGTDSSHTLVVDMSHLISVEEQNDT